MSAPPRRRATQPAAPPYAKASWRDVAQRDAAKIAAEAKAKAEAEEKRKAEVEAAEKAAAERAAERAAGMVGAAAPHAQYAEVAGLVRDVSREISARSPLDLA